MLSERDKTGFTINDLLSMLVPMYMFMTLKILSTFDF